MEEICTFGILNNISEYVTIVQLMDSVGNVNHVFSVVGKWFFDLNYKKAFPWNINSLDLICACSEEDGYFEKSQVVYYTVRYVNPKQNIKACAEVIRYSYESLCIYICDRIMVAILIK